RFGSVGIVGGDTRSKEGDENPERQERRTDDRGWTLPQQPKGVTAADDDSRRGSLLNGFFKGLFELIFKRVFHKSTKPDARVQRRIEEIGEKLRKDDKHHPDHCRRFDQR